MSRLSFLRLPAGHLRSRVAWLAAILLVLAGMAYIALSAYVLASSLARQPLPAPQRSPVDDSLKAEAVSFTSVPDGVALSGWLMRSAGTRAIVLVHGIDSYGWEGAAQDLAIQYFRAGFDVLVFDLRAHGRSGGDRRGLGWDERADVMGAVEFLLSRGIPAGRIGLHGTSYGAAAALLAAAKIPQVGAIVADSAFADVRDLVSVQVAQRSGVPAALVDATLSPGINALASLVYGFDLERIAVEKAVPAIAPRPIFFIHGEQDNTIPVAHARRLKAASRGPNDRLWILPGRRHTECIRLEGIQRPVSPIRSECIATVTAFFEHWLR